MPARPDDPVLLARLSTWTGLPVISLLVLFIVVRAGIGPGTRAAPDRQLDGRGDRTTRSASVAPDNGVTAAFFEWVKARTPEKAATTGRQKIPVFMVAAQGGGIYAASGAVATFLAFIQDQNPCFARHLFAVSGVSGGAVGSALFSASLGPSEVALDKSCSENQRPETSHTKIVRGVITEDHLSPVLLVPEYAEKLLFGFSARNLMKLRFFAGRLTRATALEASLACAFDAQAKPKTAAGWWPHICDVGNITTGLKQQFAKHFDPKANRPALVLNTTSADTGMRVAYANFGSKSVGEGLRIVLR